MKTAVDKIDDAMYKADIVRTETKTRGIIEGVPIGVDEYETDEGRLGYYFDKGNSELDTVYLDEIIDCEFIRLESVGLQMAL